MNLSDQLELFEDNYLKSTNGDIFEAINVFVDDAHKLHATYQGRLDNSECLTAVLTSKLPCNIDERKFVMVIENSYYQKYINEALSQIDDKDVRISVSKSMQQSVSTKSLKYVYLNSLTNAQKSRVRILCKMIWYNLYPRKGHTNDKL